MNTFRAINIEYLRASRTVETIIVSNKATKKVLFVYNYEGYSYRVFTSVMNLISFFEGKRQSDYHFESENDLDKFMSNFDLDMD